MSKTIDRLEQMLTIWEHQSFLYALLRMAGTVKERRMLGVSRRQAEQLLPDGPETNWRKFRKYVLSYRGGEFDEYRFMNFDVWNHLGESSLAVIPGLFAAWMAFSRQVYRLSPELQTLLELTSVSNLRWSDIPWPFEAFAVQFERPIRASENTQFDMMLVNRHSLITYVPEEPNKRPDLEMMLLPTNLGDFVRLDWRKMQRLERLLDLGRNEQLIKEVNLFSLNQPGQQRMEMSFGFTRFKPDERIVDALDRAEGSHDLVTAEHVKALDVALRIVVGLCVYLSNLPPKHTAVQLEGPDPPPDPDVRAITSGAHVCTVLSSFTLTQEERRELGTIEAPRQYHQLSPHWRRGHYRREPGQGQNPRAPRCIWVRPTLVRKDLLRPGMQVGGAQVEVE